MIKNNCTAFLLSVLFISCGGNIDNQNIEKENNDQKSQKKKVKITKISDNVQVLDIESNTSEDNEDEEVVYLPLDVLIVSPDDLKVDGNQRYFLNDTLFTGVSRKYEEEKLVFEIPFERGRKHGVTTFWHDNGQKKSILTFSHGIAKGDFKIWDKSGNLVKQGVN